MKIEVILFILVTITLVGCGIVSAATVQVDTGPGALQADGDSLNPSITPDGRYVAFESNSTSLGTGNTNGECNVYVKDGWYLNNAPIRASISTDGTAPNGDSKDAAITPDGRYVAFASNATNLVQPNTDGKWNIFVYDGWTGITILASRGLNLALANGDSTNPSITPEGRYITFQSTATNLINGDTNDATDIFVYDGWTDTTILISRGLNWTQPNGNSTNPSITPNGRYITFQSIATNIIPNDTNNKSDIFVLDGWTGITILVSRGLNWTQPNGNSTNPSITPNGRYITFQSTATNLINGDTNDATDIFVYDGWTDTTILISRGLNLALANGDSTNPSITSDGRYITFQSTATNIIPDDINNKSDIFVLDGWNNNNILVSVGINSQSNDDCYNPSITQNGRYISFDSSATNLVPNEIYGRSNVFVYDGWTPQIQTNSWGLITVAASNAASESKTAADYVCDGINDELEIQAAIDRLSSVGGVVRLTEGIFKLWHNYDAITALATNKSFITIEGSGESTVLEVQEDIWCFKLLGGPGNGWYYPNAQSGVVFKDIAFTSKNPREGSGIVISGSINHLSVRNSFFNALYSGISFEGQSHAVEISGCIFDSNIRSIVNSGISHDFRIINNKEMGQERLGMPTIPTYFIYGYTGEIFEWLITSNSIEHVYNADAMSAAIYIANTVKTADVIINSNSIEECNFGIYIKGNFELNNQLLSNLIINGNSLRDNDINIYLTNNATAIIDSNNFICFTGNQDTVIEAYDFTNGIIKVTDNLITGFPGDRIYVSTGTTIPNAFDVDNNTIL